MSDQNSKTQPSDEGRFVERAQTLLREQADNLDGATRSRLTQARFAALEAAQRKAPNFDLRRWGMPVAGATAAAVFAVFLSIGPRQSALDTTNPTAAVQADHATESNGIDDMDIVNAEEGLEFYRDVDFYAWLDAELGSELNGEGTA